MSDFTYQPTYGAQLSREPRVHVAPFGDGYEQRVTDGINTTPQVWGVTFTSVLADIDAIETFLAAKAGVTAFTWTPRGASEITVVCGRWTRSSAGLDSISAEFRQVFE